MATLEKAIALASQKHEGQLDKAGKPYILHPLRVMANVETIDEKIVAILHDVVEDTDVSFLDLLAMGFEPHIVEAIEALTKQKGESRLAAAYRTSKNIIACKVKLADLDDNMDTSRLSKITSKDIDRLHQYIDVTCLLKNALSKLNS